MLMRTRNPLTLFVLLLALSVYDDKACLSLDCKVMNCESSFVVLTAALKVNVSSPALRLKSNRSSSATSTVPKNFGDAPFVVGTFSALLPAMSEIAPASAAK